ncbi:DUF2497 domain-containing protein [Sphingomonadales bacterium 56]|uniref:DUF2497 domain-containing protein n=1 Tax=unclassified Sphingobium TaxID=2611147 RepID=UPI001917EB38|nr:MULTISPECIES: DUF2497 domain-containing protein [unclassified Sphingobium]MBY2928207.1 DUF2497 domain-containing protein [Sphingomonadales bacterium 56]MBY2958307.1 DUF2497 domain-containing protein [Sphingomonadales bacterium 58]CAD7336788.1 hypothetical protein SPHS6_01193 [Sphingobium sp. S6]CAD7336847.1 hypothetical protein SPHS8_01231 [Sphingobium sp. S8]
MGDMSKEPSMEDILSSIKRIIAEEGEEAAQAVSRRGKSDTSSKQAAQTADPAVEEVLELTDELGAEEPMPAHKTADAPRVELAGDDNSILSVESEVAARHSLSTLSSMLVTPKEGEDNTLDGLVRSMLKPMLKEWLDARLPALVEEMVAKEIARITGR